MPVSTIHPEYSAMSDDWAMTRDAANGIDKKNGRKYLPVFSPADPDRDAALLLRAYYLGFTGRTREALVGAIFRVDPEINVPAELEYMLNDSDGDGQSLKQVSKRQCSDLLTVGRYGFLVDYPQIPKGAGKDKEAIDALNLKASILSYDAESIINWKTKRLGGVNVLCMVVLREKIEIVVDKYESGSETAYRVLALDDEGYYFSVVVDEEGEALEEPVSPTDKDGNNLSFIPFVFNGAIDNKPSADLPPLKPLAIVNIAHYRNSADFEENLFMHGQLTLGISSKMSGDDFNASNPNGVQVGARKGHFLGEGGSFTTATVPANTGLREALQDKEDQAVSIGARLITQKSATITAEAAAINSSSETSVLHTLAGNASEALQTAIKYATFFMGGDPKEVAFTLNTDFFDTKLDPQSIMAMIQLANRGDVAQSDVRGILRRAKIIPQNRTDDEIDDEYINGGFPLSNPVVAPTE